jgi:hypothetical protein
MLRQRTFKKIIKIILIFIIVVNISYLLFLNINNDDKNNDVTLKPKDENFLNRIELKSPCSCRGNIIIFKDELKQVLKVKSPIIDDFYEIYYGNKTKEEVGYDLIKPKFKCDLYKTLFHGPKTKVVSFSLYGKNFGYYNNIEKTVNQVKNLFPQWLMRVNYDNSINKTIICELECKYDIISWCDMNNIQTIENLIENFDKMREKQEKELLVQGANYGDVHGMIWRFFPIADDFVDYFSSRDLDSELIERERDSVDVWLRDKTEFHIMRDNPQHNIFMLGGTNILI